MSTKSSTELESDEKAQKRAQWETAATDNTPETLTDRPTQVLTRCDKYSLLYITAIYEGLLNSINA
jgi:hypothetical protein